MAMIRKQIYIEAGQEMRLKRISKDLGISEAELIRQGIDRCLSSSVQIPRDPGLWDEEKTFIRGLMRKGRVKGERTWSRDELHER
jgi:hypothetical protein